MKLGLGEVYIGLMFRNVGLSCPELSLGESIDFGENVGVGAGVEDTVLPPLFGLALVLPESVPT